MTAPAASPPARRIPTPPPWEQAAFAAGSLRSPGPMLERLHRRYGPVARVGYGPLQVTCLFGREANEHILATVPQSFRWREAFRLLEMVDGETALVMSDGDEHRRRRRLVQPAFARKRIDAHAELIVDELDRTLAGWTPGRRLDAHRELRAAVRRIVVRALFGAGLAGRAEEIGELLEPGMRHIQRPPFARVDVDVTLTHYGRAMRAKRRADALVHDEIARRRAEGVDAERDHDILTALLAATADEGGAALSDVEVRDQVISLVAAGYDTTAAAAAWLVHALGSHPDVAARLREEVLDVVGEDATPTIEDLRRLPTVDGVVHETLRLWPAGAAAGRWVVEPVEFAGHRIEPDRLVLYSAWVTHRLPELWPDPERFDPGRWAPGAPEPQPYSFVPFGGGYRRCIGFALATLELQLLAVRLAQRARFTLERPVARAVGVATTVPAGGVPIRIG